MAVINSSKFNFSENIKQMLDHYLIDDVVPAMYEAIDEVSKEAVRKLKAESPRGATGKYAKGWTRKMDGQRIGVGATVYGKSGTYQLAHLLEHGHAKRGGGRVKSLVHIAPVEDWAVKEAFDRMVDKLEGI